MESPYRALVGPFVAYLDVLDQTWSPDREAPTTVVVLPEYVGRHWRDRFLYNQAARRLRAVLVGREHTVILDVPYRRGQDGAAATPPRRPGGRARDRRPTTAPGAQGRRPAGAGGATPLAVLPVHRPGDAHREGGRVAGAGGVRGVPAQTIRRFLFGRRLSNEEEAFERLPKKLALPIFSSDAISSSAYATEEILRVFVVAGAGALLVSIQMALAIVGLLTVVSLSYRQVCRAYPSGGGAYVVARENISHLAGLVAAAALLIDYVMTVAVSTASAVSQVYSVVPELYDIRIEIALGAIALITIANLRGLREAGLFFASPTYLFVGMTLLMIGLGIARIATGQAPASAPPADQLVPLGTQPLGIILILRAFAAGSVALTGVEAIANGVPAFKPPEAKNAANTMLTMAILLGVLFIGITIVADGFGIRPTEEGGPTVVAMVAAAVFGDGTILFVVFQARHGADPLPGRQHQLQRVPAARRDPGRGRVHAAPVRVPRRPPRVLVGDRRPGDGRRG